MKTEFLQKVSTGLNKTAFKIKKASPELLIVGGAIGVVAAAVGACCATRKIDTIIDEHKADVEKIHEAESNEAISYDHKDAQHDLTVTYAKTAWKIIKLYGPSVALGVVSIGCMITSNQILRKRNAALMAAYTAVDGAFKKYRKAVVERFGEEVDKELRYGLEKKEVTVEEEDENGKKKKVKKTVYVQKEAPELSQYARCFDELNNNYQSNQYLNLAFISNVQAWANTVLQNRGYIFLNEVYEKLGFDWTDAGQDVGWLYGKDSKGDGYVDFGMFDCTIERNEGFRLGYEPAVWLDFNVDGVIKGSGFLRHI